MEKHWLSAESKVMFAIAFFTIGGLVALIVYHLFGCCGHVIRSENWESWVSNRTIFTRSRNRAIRETTNSV